MTATVTAVLMAAALAPSSGPGERYAFARLENGASIGFALLRSGGPGPSAAIGEAALPRSNSVSRVLWDRTSGAYFGYRVEVERRGGSLPFRVSFKALDRGAVERELKKRGDCPDCPPPAPLGIGPHFPQPQSIGEGEALTLELLANPDTGERIFDVVKLSAGAVTAEAMHAASARASEGQEAVRRAEILGARGRYAEAAEEYKKALAVQPLDAGVHNKLGICYQYLQDEAMARREYERALELRPSYAEAWNNLGTLEQSSRRFKQAVRAYKKAIAIKPTLATAWKNVGHAYVALGQIQDAFEAYREAFRLDPAVLESQALGVPSAGVDVAMQNYYLAKLLALNGQNDKAIELLRLAREAGFRDFARVQSDPDFRTVVQDPRFRELAQPN
jgi:tetratricopeptide (TPR) repeat protein